MRSKLVSNDRTLRTDIAVIGGGGAGLAAAVAAAEKGADVILLEMHRKPGGNSAMAMGLFAVESPVQRKMFINTRKEDLFREAMRFARWTINPRIIQVFIDKSGDTIRWLEEKGVKFSIPTTGVNPYMTWHCPEGYGKGHGALLIDALTKNFKELGGRLLCETRAKEIIINDDKIVTGLLAESKGEKLRILAKSIIIATGGYGGNKKLLKKYCPYYSNNVLLGGFPNMGDGLLMANKMGAANEGLGLLQLEASCTVPKESQTLMVVAQQPYTVWLNKRGERYIDEAFITEFNMFEAAFAVIRQPDYISYTIFDEKIMQVLVEGDGTIKPMSGIASGSRITNLMNLLESAVKRGNVKIDKSLDVIAKWMGAEPEVLKANIEEYNCFCDQKYDEMFFKDRRYLFPLRTPPYYALRTLPRFLGTSGGIKINHYMQILDKKDNPIVGGYAAGIDVGGWEPDSYNQNLAGSAFGFAVNSGRIAGENAAAFVKEKSVKLSRR